MGNTTAQSLDHWLAVFDSEAQSNVEIWDPGFDGDRCLVVGKFWPFRRAFERPVGFSGRFFHTLYPLSIENWQIDFDTPLYGGGCTLSTHLTILFQPTVAFAKRTLEAAPDFNSHIKNRYLGLLMDSISAELIKLDNTLDWLDTGLASIEESCATSINEILMVRGIQCRARCVLSPYFAEQDAPESDRFTHSEIYLRVLKKQFEFRQKKEAERYKQEELLEQMRVEQKQALLKVIDWEDELERKKQAMEAEADLRQLEEKKLQRQTRNDLQFSLHEDQVNHKLKMKNYEFTKDTELLQAQQAHQQSVALEMQAQELEHNLLIKKKQRENELKCFEENRLQLLQAKDHEEQIKQIEIQTKLKRQEILQLEQLKLAERIEQEKLNHQARMTRIQIQSEMKALEIRARATSDKDTFLRREIEWLVLEKQRAELKQAINASTNPPTESAKSIE